MEIRGKIIRSLPPETGQGKSKPWKKRPIIIETQGPYPRQVCIEFWNDKIGLLTGLKAGLLVAITVELQSRESSGRWYTTANGVGLYVVEEVAPSRSAPADKGRRVEREPQYDDSADDLPF